MIGFIYTADSHCLYLSSRYRFKRKERNNERMKVVLIDIIVNCIDLLLNKSSIYKLGKYQNFKLYRFFFSKLFLIV